MHTKDGWLHMTKTERKEIETVLRHCEIDLSYGGGGSFSKMDADNSYDEREGKKAQEGIAHVRWILSAYLD